jgi:hypothetical protein
VDIDHDLDFSTRTAPDSWYEAAALAPKTEERAFRQASLMPVLPQSERADLLLACLTAVAMSVVCGYAWYRVDTTGSLRSPWLAVGLGIMIALSVRLGGGPADPDVRAALACGFYVVTVVAVLFLASRHTYLELYGANRELASFEQELIRTRADPLSVVAWISGGVAAARLSLLLGHRP